MALAYTNHAAHADNHAFAQEDLNRHGDGGGKWYGRIAGGYVLEANKYSSNTDEEGWSINGAVGRDFIDYRLEAELDYWSIEDTTLATPGEDDLLALMFNGYYDIKNEQIKPYIGMGVGPAFFSNDDDDGVDVAYNLMAGIGFDLAPMMRESGINIRDDKLVDIGYRLFNTFDNNDSDGIHEILVGLRLEL